HITTAHASRLLLPEPSLRSGPRHGPLPLSYAQQRLWFLAQLGHSRHAYSLLEAIRLCGPLQVEALEQSFQEIVRRHEVLRTTFTNVNGQPFQVVGTATPLPVSTVALRALSQHEREMQVHALAQAEVQRPFDSDARPLVACYSCTSCTSCRCRSRV